MTDILIKCAAIALVGAVCALLIKSKNPEQSFVLSMLCAVCVCFAAVCLISQLSGFVEDVIAVSGISSAIYTPVIKCVGIALLTRIVCELCKDAGQSATSAAMEYLGSAAAVLVVLPLMQSMLKSIGDLV